MRVLVTGGAGYIGSHVTRQLVEAGHDVTVYDNLGTGFRWATLGAPLIEADLADTARLDATLEAGRFDAVLHFAAHIVVPESVADPLKYYANNTRNTLGLLQAMARHGVRRLVFSSTAAVYGNPEHIPVAETAPLLPINPYGSSKLMSEWMIRDLAATGALGHVTLRYFNVAGADPGGRLGQATPAATHLIKVACELACGKRE
ncbi:UDP-glucose 4-epimerase GalE, partial [Immundisolibacter sp.]|uniref:UDP-glucose 4-epimerase GalE n=1 Tax=Immundisolibacter sp. TaxID=1934948 RepID=UPI00260871E8